MGKHKNRNKETGDIVTGTKDSNLNVQINESGDDVIVNKKAKKKKKKRDKEGHETNKGHHAAEPDVITETSQDDVHKKVKYLKQDLQENPSENLHSEHAIKKHKKKKRRKDKDFDCELSKDSKDISNKSDLEEEAGQKNRKRTKQINADEKGENDINIDSNSSDADEVPKKKRKKKSKEIDIVNSVEINSVKKKKKKDELENESTCIGESHVLAISCVDENRTSSKSENDIITRADKDKGEVKGTHNKGQWHTNVFEDKEKQNKFLRLLGGFKTSANKSLIQQKLFTNNNVKSGGSSPQFGGSLAMDKSEQEKYNKTMTTEYESAMSMHLNKGLGLGFQKPQPTKLFNIDTQNSKSIKFDDSD